MGKLKFNGITAANGATDPADEAPVIPSQGIPTTAIQRVVKDERVQEMTLLEIGRIHNKNMQIMGRTPEYLYKGMKAGLPIEELFMIAVRGVAAAINDPMLEKVMERGLEERKQNNQ